MNQLFWKISAVLLLIALLIIVIDKTKVGLQLNGIGYKIAEKTKIIQENEEKYRKELDALRKEIRQRDERFRLQFYSQSMPDAVGSGCPQASDPEDAGAGKAAGRIAADSARTPETLIHSFREKLITENILPDRFRIDPESGIVVSRAASILAMAADIAGLDTRTTLVWDLKNFSLGTSTEVIRQPASVLKKEETPATLNISARPRNADSILLQQRDPSTTVFPLSAEGPFPSETDLIPPGAPIPLGGLYLHFIRIRNSADFMLEYEFPDGIQPEDIRLQPIPLLPGMSIRSAANNSVQSFLIRPDASQDAVLLIAGDQPFLPVRITLSAYVPKFELSRKDGKEKPENPPADGNHSVPAQ